MKNPQDKNFLYFPKFRLMGSNARSEFSTSENTFGENVETISIFPASEEFCRLLMIFANCEFCPDLDPNHL